MCDFRGYIYWGGSNGSNTRRNTATPPELWRTPNAEHLKGHLYDTLHTWVKLPARDCLHGVTKLAFPVEQWLKEYPDSIYNLSNETFQTRVTKFPRLYTITPEESRGATS
eukprot:6091763-Amphidinium_carterae.1